MKLDKNPNKIKFDTLIWVLINLNDLHIKQNIPINDSYLLNHSIYVLLKKIEE